MAKSNESLTMPGVRYLYLSSQVVIGHERHFILPAQSCGADSTFLVSSSLTVSVDLDLTTGGMKRLRSISEIQIDMYPSH